MYVHVYSTCTCIRVMLNYSKISKSVFCVLCVCLSGLPSTFSYHEKHSCELDLFDMYIICPIPSGFLLSGLNMLVMMLFFNLFLGSYMIFQVWGTAIRTIMRWLNVLYSEAFSVSTGLLEAYSTVFGSWDKEWI